MPSVPENQERGSKILASISASTGSCFSPSAMLRLMVCDTSMAEDHSFANASLACIRPCASYMPFGAMAAGFCCPEAFAKPEKKLCCKAANSLPPRPHNSASACMYSNGVTSEHHDLPYRFTLVQPVEAGVDLSERQTTAHQPVDRQFAASIELDVARQVASGHAGADVAA